MRMLSVLSIGLELCEFPVTSALLLAIDLIVTESDDQFFAFAITTQVRGRSRTLERVHRAKPT